MAGCGRGHIESTVRLIGAHQHVQRADSVIESDPTDRLAAGTCHPAGAGAEQRQQSLQQARFGAEHVMTAAPCSARGRAPGGPGAVYAPAWYRRQARPAVAPAGAMPCRMAASSAAALRRSASAHPVTARLQVGSDGALLGCDGRRVVVDHP